MGVSHCLLLLGSQLIVDKVSFQEDTAPYVRDLATNGKFLKMFFSNVLNFSPKSLWPRVYSHSIGANPGATPGVFELTFTEVEGFSTDGFTNFHVFMNNLVARVVK